MYHINEKTGNPNVCRTKNCGLTHYASKEEALKPSLKDSIEAVKTEVGRDEAVGEARNEGLVTTKKVSTKERLSVAAEVANEEARPVRVQVTDQSSITVHPANGTKRDRRSKKQKVRDLAHDALYHLDRLAQVAPDHPLVRKTRKSLKKFSKKNKTN